MVKLGNITVVKEQRCGKAAQAQVGGGNAYADVSKAPQLTFHHMYKHTSLVPLLFSGVCLMSHSTILGHFYLSIFISKTTSQIPSILQIQPDTCYWLLGLAWLPIANG